MKNQIALIILFAFIPLLSHSQTIEDLLKSLEKGELPGSSTSNSNNQLSDQYPAIVYRDKNYKGTSDRLKVGKYKARNLKVRDNSISSFKVKSGYEVILNDTDSHGGAADSGQSSKNVRSGMDNRTSSITVRKASGGGGSSGGSSGGGNNNNTTDYTFKNISGKTKSACAKDYNHASITKGQKGFAYIQKIWSTNAVTIMIEACNRSAGGLGGRYEIRKNKVNGPKIAGENISFSISRGTQVSTTVRLSEPTKLFAVHILNGKTYFLGEMDVCKKGKCPSSGGGNSGGGGSAPNLHIYAKGDVGQEKMRLSIKTSKKKDWTVSRSFKKYSFAINNNTRLQDIRVEFINDGNVGNKNKNLAVDKIVYKGKTYQTEAGNVETILRNGQSKGFRKKQKMPWNGYFKYGSSGSGNNGGNNSGGQKISLTGKTSKGYTLSARQPVLRRNNFETTITTTERKDFIKSRDVAFWFYYSKDKNFSEDDKRGFVHSRSGYAIRSNRRYNLKEGFDANKIRQIPTQYKYVILAAQDKGNTRFIFAVPLKIR